MIDIEQYRLKMIESAILHENETGNPPIIIFHSSDFAKEEKDFIGAKTNFKSKIICISHYMCFKRTVGIKRPIYIDYLAYDVIDYNVINYWRQKNLLKWPEQI